MTTYSYKISLNGSEVIMLKKALNNMIKHCDENIDKGSITPYWAHRDSAKSVLNKLFKNISRESGNNFFNHDE